MAGGYADRISAIQMDATQPLPFPENYFDAIFCMNSFNFYGGSVDFLKHLLRHLKPAGQLCIGSEVLSSDFTEAQIANPPHVYAFRLPPPNEHVNVFEDDFRKQHTSGWWKNLFHSSGLLDVEDCHELEDADVIYGELVRYEYEHNTVSCLRFIYSPCSNFNIVEKNGSIKPRIRSLRPLWCVPS